MNSDFARWFAGSVVVDDRGRPLRVYRGEHGCDSDALHSRRGSLCFAQSHDVANLYAEKPNDYPDRQRPEGERRPRVIPAYLSIKRPIMNDPSDPFIDFALLAKVLGSKRAVELAGRFDGQIRSTNNWEEIESEYRQKGEYYSTVPELLKEHPERVNDLYCNAFAVLDDPEVVRLLRQAGYDGAVHAGYGDNNDEAEYRVFSPEQVRPAIGARAAIEAVS